MTFPHQNLSENFIGVVKYKRSEDYSSSKLSEILKLQLLDWNVTSITNVAISVNFQNNENAFSIFYTPVFRRGVL